MTAGAAARGNQAARWPDATLPHRVPVPRALRSGTLPAQIDYSVRHSQTRVAAPSASISAVPVGSARGGPLAGRQTGGRRAGALSAVRLGGAGAGPGGPARG